jgi:hypothetical protein
MAAEGKPVERSDQLGRVPWPTPANSRSVARQGSGGPRNRSLKGPVAGASNADCCRRPAASIHGETADALRGLINEIRVTPEGNGNSVELIGELGAMLRAAGSKKAASVDEAARSGLLVAGTCNQLCRTKLQ